jgi:hypothetical protein
MVNLGDNGFGGNHAPPLEAEIQGSNDLLEVDMYRESPLFVMNTSS